MLYFSQLSNWILHTKKNHGLYQRQKNKNKKSQWMWSERNSCSLLQQISYSSQE